MASKIPDFHVDITSPPEQWSLHNREEMLKTFDTFLKTLDKSFNELQHLQEFLEGGDHEYKKKGEDEETYYKRGKIHIILKSRHQLQKLEEESVMKTIGKKFRDFNIPETDDEIRELESNVEKASHYKKILLDDVCELLRNREKKFMIDDYVSTMDILRDNINNVNKKFSMKLEEIEILRKELEVTQQYKLRWKSCLEELMEDRKEINDIYNPLRDKRDNVDEIPEVKKKISKWMVEKLTEKIEKLEEHNIVDEDIKQQKLTVEDS